MVFKVLDDPSVADTIQSLPPCMLDVFTKTFLEKFPGEALLGSDAKCCLSVLALLTKTETVQIEWGHSRMHRLISSSSVQTHVPHMKFVNAQWVLQRYSERRFPRGLGAVRRRFRKAKQQVAKRRLSPRPKALKRTGAGGSWRAWVNKAARGQSGQADFKMMAERYRKAKQEGTVEYQEASERGASATARKREGAGSGFGRLGSVPELLPFADSLKPVPHPELNLFDFRADLHEGAKAIASWAAATKRSSNLAAVLHNDWMHKNRLIKEQEALPAPDGVSGRKKLCLQRGFCSCSERGKQRPGVLHLGKRKPSFSALFKRRLSCQKP